MTPPVSARPSAYWPTISVVPSFASVASMPHWHMPRTRLPATTQDALVRSEAARSDDPALRGLFITRLPRSESGVGRPRVIVGVLAPVVLRVVVPVVLQVHPVQNRAEELRFRVPELVEGPLGGVPARHLR